MPRGRGSHSTAFKDLTGMQFGLWTVIGRAPNRGPSRTMWHCECSCGKTKKIVVGLHLTKGASTNCGCAREGASNGRYAHGGADSGLYTIWLGMKQRCANHNHISFKNYGGRGISVCNKWLNDFAAFRGDVGERPFEGATLDRIDNDGNYEPGNVRWATPKMQAANRRSYGARQ